MSTVKTKPETAIESNIPLPATMGPRSELSKMLARMKPKQSFTTSRQVSSIYSLARYYGIKIAVRDLGDGSVRVWRTK